MPRAQTLLPMGRLFQVCRQALKKVGPLPRYVFVYNVHTQRLAVHGTNQVMLLPWEDGYSWYLTYRKL